MDIPRHQVGDIPTFSQVIPISLGIWIFSHGIGIMCYMANSIVASGNALLDLVALQAILNRSTRSR